MNVTNTPDDGFRGESSDSALDPADPTEGGKYPLRGKQPYRYDDPFAPAWDGDEWEWDQRNI